MNRWKKFGRAQFVIMLVPMLMAAVVGYVAHAIVKGYKIGWNTLKD